MAFGLGFHIISAPSFASQGGLPPPPPAAKATYLDFIRSRHTLQNALALSSYGPTSNAQHDQRYKSDADEQHYERDGVVFEPMPITGKHDVSSLFQMDCENRSAVAHPKLRRIFCRRRHQPSRPPPAKIRPGRPAPAIGPGTAANTACSAFAKTSPVVVKLDKVIPNHGGLPINPKGRYSSST